VHVPLLLAPGQEFELERLAPSHGCHCTLVLVEFDGEHDYLHVLVNYPPKISVFSLVNSIKSVLSRLIRQERHHTIRSQFWGGALWSPSYTASSCGGAPITVVR
jgi:putative transposase